MNNSQERKSIQRYGFYGNGVFDSKHDGGYVHHEDYAALEAKCAALAAENAALKDAISSHAAGFTVCEACGEENISGNDDVCRALNETPATDAFLAEVRASGVEMFAAWNDKHINPGVEHKESLTAVSHAARGFSAQLRKGVQS